MSRKRRQFSREFKVEAVRLATAGDRTVAQVARELGVNAGVLRSSKRQLDKSGAETPVADVFPGNGKLTSADEELRRLRRENAVLREERDILKRFFTEYRGFGVTGVLLGCMLLTAKLAGGERDEAR